VQLWKRSRRFTTIRPGIAWRRPDAVGACVPLCCHVPCRAAHINSHAVHDFPCVKKSSGVSFLLCCHSCKGSVHTTSTDSTRLDSSRVESSRVTRSTRLTRFGSELHSTTTSLDLLEWTHYSILDSNDSNEWLATHSALADSISAPNIECVSGE